jgi:SAM-dependent methyltransferase
MMNKPWYEQLYENFADYDDEPYTKNTSAEVDFIEEVIDFEPQTRILDIGCGTGRHTLALSRRGYDATGLDLSEELLEQARAKANRAGLSCRFVQGDARKLEYQAAFNLALILCEGGFSLMETDAMDRMILQNAFEALTPGGTLIMTAPSAVFMLVNQPENPDFNPLTLRETFSMDIQTPAGETKTIPCSQRYYSYPELRCLLSEIGFQQITPFAVTPEGYSYQEPITPDHFELGVTALKS